MGNDGRKNDGRISVVPMALFVAVGCGAADLAHTCSCRATGRCRGRQTRPTRMAGDGRGLGGSGKSASRSSRPPTTASHCRSWPGFNITQVVGSDPPLWSRRVGGGSGPSPSSPKQKQWHSPGDRRFLDRHEFLPPKISQKCHFGHF